MDSQELSHFRKRERERLIAARLAVDAHTLETWRTRIDALIENAFPQLAEKKVAFCWPTRNEYDARHLVRRLRARGALSALPVVHARNAPLIFREWHPGVQLARGPLAIPYPIASQEIAPDAVLLPMVGWDTQGFRLGYGGGYFDRTLAALDTHLLVIGVAYELSRIETIRPQPWDVPMDFVVTERRVYRRDGEALVALE